MRVRLTKPVPPTHAGHKRSYRPEIRDLAGKSGVYAIFSAATGQPLYVGESHSDQLADTLTRHFRRSKIDPDNDATGRRRGGTTYDRHAVTVAWAVTAADRAQEAQAALIAALAPRDNINANPPAPRLSPKRRRAEEAVYVRALKRFHRSIHGDAFAKGVALLNPPPIKTEYEFGEILGVTYRRRADNTIRFHAFDTPQPLFSAGGGRYILAGGSLHNDTWIRG